MQWDALYAREADRLAAGILPFVLGPELTMQRRIEDVSIVSRSVVRRSVTVDIVLPAAGPERDAMKLDPSDAGSPLLVMLAVLEKEQLIDFDLSEGGASLPLLRSGLNVVVAAALLASFARAEGVAGQDIQAALPSFEALAGPDRARARRAFDALFPVGGTEPLAKSPNTRLLAQQLRDSYLLLAEVPDRPERHRLFRFATDQRFKGPSWHIAERLGLQSAAVTFPIPGVTQTPSYHAEFMVPDGCIVVGAGVSDGGPVRGAKVDVTGDRAAIYPPAGLSRNAEVVLRISHQPGLFFLPAAIIAVLISVVLAAGAIVTWAGVDPQTTASALVLSGLGAVSGLAIRSGEAALTAELHTTARLVLVAVVLAAVGAAGAIAFGATSTTLAALWSGFFLISAAGAVTLTVGAVVSILGKRQTTR